MTAARPLKPCAGRCGYLVEMTRPHRVLNEHVEMLRDGATDVLCAQDLAYYHLGCTHSRWRNRLAHTGNTYRYYVMEAASVASDAAGKVYDRVERVRKATAANWESHLSTVQERAAVNWVGGEQ